MPDLFDGTSSEILFQEQYYHNSNFKGIRVSGRQLSDKEFVHCTFANCDLHGCTLSDCVFEDCSFSDCDLSVVKIRHSGFLGVKFTGCKLIGIDWTQIKKPIDFQFERCNMNDSVFAGLALSATKFLDCTLTGGDFAKANLGKCVFDSVDLSGAMFLNTNLTRCLFKSADFSRAKIQNSDLTFADFSTARNYQINPSSNKLKKIVFFLLEAVLLFGYLDIVLK